MRMTPVIKCADPGGFVVWLRPCLYLRQHEPFWHYKKECMIPLSFYLFLYEKGKKKTMIPLEVLFSFLQNFKTLQDSTSHRIFERIHEVLNVAK